MEHRWGERIKVSLEARLWNSAYEPMRGRIVNLSSSGAFVRTEQPLVPLTQLRVELELPGQFGGRRVIVPASVVRNDRGGAGIEWCEPLPFRTGSLANVIVRPGIGTAEPARL